ncbi:MAG: DUF1127 domain-containing protein [Ectothiorhodospiraceae bacterium]|nr:DUF1127 domain-containing protein [Chromatiales bacterium]MCP5155505.1 DUF1127 domain-containing protein [Ectothiorhodospiraceae bacterium]
MVDRAIPGPQLVLAAIGRWGARLAEREHLVGLDRRLLRDVGLTRADAVREASKPFWRR